MGKAAEGPTGVGMIEDTFTTPLESAEALFEAGQGIARYLEIQSENPYPAE